VNKIRSECDPERLIVDSSLQTNERNYRINSSLFITNDSGRNQYITGPDCEIACLTLMLWMVSIWFMKTVLPHQLRNHLIKWWNTSVSISDLSIWFPWCTNWLPRILNGMLGTEQQALNTDLMYSQDRSYEVRRYEAAKWVSTVVTTASWKAATSIGFKRLFRYIQGANDAGTLYVLNMKQLQV